MLAKKKKLTRKEIKEDKLVATYYKAYNYVDENRKQMLIYAGVLLAVVVGVLLYLNYKSSLNEEASLHLGRVMFIYDEGNYLEAIEGRPAQGLLGLQRIVEEYGSTESGETAKIFLANSYFMLGRYEDAKKYYGDYSGGSSIFKAAAIAGEAGFYASNNEHKKAADLYKRASRISEHNAMNPEYMLNAAINYMRAGDNEEAKDLLERIKRNHTASTAFREVDRYLTQIN
jgi:tetratricopeptide (TPR) repeat protein